jgi:hypothetical protein
MALLMLKSFPAPQALTRVRDGLKRLNAVIGVTGRGYHETITVAFLRIVASRLSLSPWTSWQGFQAANADLLASKYLERHYSPERLDLPEAKTAFLEPDRDPLP